MEYNIRLQELMNEIVLLRGCESKRKHLEKQVEDLKDKVSDLEQKLYKEQADVEKLESFSFASLIARLAGKKEEKLEKEQLEAYEAAARLEVAKQELEYVNSQLWKVKDDQMRLRELEGEYEQLLLAKKEAIRADNPEIGQLEMAIIERNKLLKELKEALDAGNKALSITDAILEKLGEASDWGTWDLLGGGLIADMAKHSTLDDAQILVGNLQNQLHRFKTELADVKIQSDLQISIEGFSRFADYFFDGIFADWSILNKIDASIEQVNHTRTQIRGAVRKLEDMQRTADTQKRQLEIDLKNKVLEL